MEKVRILLQKLNKGNNFSFFELDEIKKSLEKLFKSEKERRRSYQNHLPQDLLKEVSEYLTFRERVKTIYLTCKTWKNSLQSYVARYPSNLVPISIHSLVR